MNLDIEVKTANARSHLTIMRNEIGSHDVNHKFLPRIDTVDAALIQMNEMIQKQQGDITRLKQQISKL
jgi:hypothetical protein